MDTTTLTKLFFSSDPDDIRLLLIELQDITREEFSAFLSSILSYYTGADAVYGLVHYHPVIKGSYMPMRMVPCGKMLECTHITEADGMKHKFSLELKPGILVMRNQVKYSSGFRYWNIKTGKFLYRVEMTKGRVTMMKNMFIEFIRRLLPDGPA